MKVKVSETTRIQLDWLVAKCEATRPVIYLEPTHFMQLHDEGRFNYCELHQHGGPILEREHIHAGPHTYGPAAVILNSWHAVIGFDPDNGEHLYEADGATMLIAGLRCYVASKLGDEVEVPDELNGENAP